MGAGGAHGRREGGLKPAARIGALFSGDASHPSYPAFREGLAAMGYVEGRDISIEARFDGGHLHRLPFLAAELAASSVNLIAAIGAVHCRAAQEVAPSIPIVFAAVVDPVAVGLVGDPERPDRNATGVTTFDPDEARDGLRILKRVVPRIKRLAILGDAGVPDALPLVSRAAAEAEGLRAQVLLLRGEEDLEGAFVAMREERADAVMGLAVPMVRVHGARIVELARAARILTLFARDGAKFGPLLAYGTSFAAAARHMAGLMDRVLKGEQVSNIPIGRVVRPELLLNLPLARSFGVMIPSDLMERATYTTR